MTLHSSNDTTIVSNLIIGKLSTEQRPGSRSYLSRILGTRSFIPTFISYYTATFANYCQRATTLTIMFDILKLNIGLRNKWDNDEHILN